jgi:hypothetical protein
VNERTACCASGLAVELWANLGCRRELGRRRSRAGRPCSMDASARLHRGRRLFDTIGGVSALLLRISLMLTNPSFASAVALGENYTDFGRARKG